MILRTSVLATMFVIGIVTTASASTFYVAPTGKDTNAGTLTKPWKTLAKVNSTNFAPGDVILLQRGGTWDNDHLSPCAATHCSGAAGSPISVDAYGSGALPRIRTNGTFSSSIYLFGQEYWEIRNLEVTNHGTTTATRSGITAICDKGATPADPICHHLIVNGNYVHDINGILNGSYLGDNCGISVSMTQAHASPYQARWDDVTIQNNTVDHIDQAGIYFGVYSGGGFPTFSASFVYPKSTNVLVSTNTISYLGGDGIVVSATNGARVESNILHDAGRSTFFTDDAHDFCNGIWTANSTSTLIQYNEVYNEICATNKCGDRMAFGADWGSISSYFQYNYTHNNIGGSIGMWDNNGQTDNDGNPITAYADDLIIRYNIFYNDYASVFTVCTGEYAGANPPDITNNTIYMAADRSTSMFGLCGQTNSTSGPVLHKQYYILSNIFYTLGQTSYPVFGVDSFYSNVYFAPSYSGTSRPINEPCAPGQSPDCTYLDSQKISTDPLFVNPTTAGVGRGSVNGLKLSTSSPAISNGYLSAYLGTQDFWGNATSTVYSPNRGAYDGAALDSTSTWVMPSTIAEWSSLLSGSGISNPSHEWLFQDAPGNCSDSFGSSPFILGGGLPLYQQPVTAWTRLSVKPRVGTVDYFGATTSDDISTTSQLLLLVVRLNANPTAQKGIALMGYLTDTNEIDINSSGRIVARNRTNSITGTVAQANKTIVLVMKVDRSIPQIVVYNNGQETLKPAWLSPAAASTMYLGNIGGADSWPDAAILYGAYWSGTAAQLSDSQVGTLISRIKNGNP